MDIRCLDFALGPSAVKGIRSAWKLSVQRERLDAESPQWLSVKSFFLSRLLCRVATSSGARNGISHVPCEPPRALAFPSHPCILRRVVTFAVRFGDALSSRQATFLAVSLVRFAG